MLRMPITFKDLDDNEVTEDFYFNLGTAELAELELSYQGGLAQYLERIVHDMDGGAIIATFKEILRKAVGRRSEDGRRFEKSDEIWLKFSQSNAYDVLFMQLVTDAEASANFIKAIVPLDMAKEFPTVLTPKGEVDNRPLYERENRRATPEEFKKMSPEEQLKAFAFQPTT